MTYKEKLDELEAQFAIKTTIYLSEREKFGIVDGEFDFSADETYLIAKTEFEVAGNEYNNFRSFVAKNKCKPDDTLS